MGDRLLATIIELEKTLREEVRREAARADGWREREVAVLELEVSAAQRELSAWLSEQTAAARLAAAAAGERRVTATAVRCARLAALQDSFLEEVLRLHLRKLLPEAGDDHPHDED
jgi:hypothetical protein